MLSLIADKMDALNENFNSQITATNANVNTLVTQQDGIVQNINQVKNTVAVQNAENNKRFEAMEAFLKERFGGQFPVSSLHSPEPSPATQR